MHFCATTENDTLREIRAVYVHSVFQDRNIIDLPANVYARRLLFRLASSDFLFVYFYCLFLGIFVFHHFCAARCDENKVCV